MVSASIVLGYFLTNGGKKRPGNPWDIPVPSFRHGSIKSRGLLPASQLYVIGTKAERASESRALYIPVTGRLAFSPLVHSRFRFHAPDVQLPERTILLLVSTDRVPVYRSSSSSPISEHLFDLFVDGSRRKNTYSRIYVTAGFRVFLYVCTCLI